MKIKNILLAICLIMNLATAAQNVTVNSVTVQPGTQSIIIVKLTGATDCIAAGFTLELPTGLFQVNSSEIDFTTNLDKNFVADHVAVPNLLNNKNLKVAIYSTTNSHFVGGNSENNSTLLKVGFKAYNMAAGTYQCKVKGIELVNSNHELTQLSNASFTITVNAISGDVDCDGTVTAADITALYNYLLNGNETYLSTSDVDGDGTITAADITAIYNIILGDIGKKYCIDTGNELITTDKISTLYNKILEDDEGDEDDVDPHVGATRN